MSAFRTLNMIEARGRQERRDFRLQVWTAATDFNGRLKDNSAGAGCVVLIDSDGGEIYIPHDAIMAMRPIWGTAE